jgi:hypothetical protein
MTVRASDRRLVALLEITGGWLLLTRGQQCWQATTGAPPGKGQAFATRALGVRYLIQGICQAGWPRALRRTWASVDGLHAATMAWVALEYPDARRPATLSACLATVNGLLSFAPTQTVATMNCEQRSGQATGSASLKTRQPDDAASTRQRNSRPDRRTTAAADLPAGPIPGGESLLGSGPPPDTTQYLVTADLQQHVIDALFDSHAGQPGVNVRAALLAALAEAGLAIPPRPWTEAVATAISHRQRFIVATSTDSPMKKDPLNPPRTDDAEPSTSTGLWFSHDPKIGHIPPRAAVEHLDDQES